MRRAHNTIRTVSGILVAGTIGTLIGLVSIGAISGAMDAAAAGNPGPSAIVISGVLLFDVLVLGGLAAAVGRARRPS